MANNYTDHAELRFELNHPLMKRIVELKERDFRDKDNFDYAPLDFEDAMDNYDRVLDITGELAGTTIAENAEGVDLEGPIMKATACATLRARLPTSTPWSRPDSTA